jgi:GNAT superfamily N-acetyltransferase
LREYYIRLARVGELQTLGSIEIESMKRFAGTGLVDHLLDRCFDQERLMALINSDQVWVACSPDNSLVGFIVVSVRGSIAYLEEMDVLPAHGRRGLGARLVSTAREWALDKGFAALTLSTFEGIAWNAPFYKRLGFSVLPTEQWSKELSDLRSEEESNGLPVHKRVFMQLNLK